ncbi:MAG TPA: galactokinase [Polyangiaceae bacterium]|nr:galactokinase [Polyangiaceae bacterium]
MTIAARAQQLARLFEQRVGEAPEGVWAAPGRANLIGEHTDYNGGFALPFGIEQCALVALRRRQDRTLHLASLQSGESQLSLAELTGERMDGWAAYVAGSAWSLIEAGARPSGFELLLDSDVPIGAGLSSSAALECATVSALSELWGFAATPIELARRAQRAENQVAGVPCGLMDQLASMCAQPGRVLFVDFQRTTVEALELPLEAAGLELLVVDTRAPHQLADGAYADRRRSCQQAAGALGVPLLRDAQLEALAHAALPAEEQRRARHVISENERVRAAVGILREGGPASRLGRLGPLLSASHASLRDDFEVSVPHLDVAQAAAESAGALGARLMGGGFGGSVLALLPRSARDPVESALRAAFRERGWSEPGLFPARPSAGARRVL